MIFTTTPTNYPSTNRPILYTVEEENPHLAEIAILNPSTGEVLGKKRLYHTLSTTFNIAPYLRCRSYPATSGDEVKVAPRASHPVAVSVDSTMSPTIYVANNAERLYSQELLTRRPLLRTISSGEWDELRVASEYPLRVEYRASTPETGDEIIRRSISSPYVMSISASPDMFAARVSAFEVRIYIGEALAWTVRYIVEPKPLTAMRIAWENAFGGIEHYTFPLVELRRQSSSRQFYTSGGYQTTLVDHSPLYVLTSAFETQAVFDSLSEIPHSRHVWLCTGRGLYNQMELLPDKTITKTQGQMCIFQIALRHKDSL